MSVWHKTLFWTALACCPLTAHAFSRGEGEPEGGAPHQYDIELSSLDVSKTTLVVERSRFHGIWGAGM